MGDFIIIILLAMHEKYPRSELNIKINDIMYSYYRERQNTPAG